MSASTSARRRLLLGAVVVLALASLVSNFPTAAAQTTPDGRTDAGPVTFEDDVAPVHITEVPADLLPPSMRPDAQAASVEPIQPNGAFGFSSSFPSGSNWGAFRFQIVQGTPEIFRTWVQSAATQLTILTNVSFTVDPGTVPRPAGHASGLYTTPATDSSTWGTIRVESIDPTLLGDVGPCRGQPLGEVVGCGGPNPVSAGGRPLIVRGEIWLSSNLQGRDSLADVTTAHEAGHVLGLNHFNGTYTDGTQLMNASVSGSHTGVCNTRYRRGDRNGVWYLENRFAWLVTAQYRDFLGRIPDFAGYDFWLRSGVDANGLATSLSSSAEWVGKVVDELYVGFRGGPVESTSAREFWSARIRQFGVPAVAAEMYASDEYFANHGGNLDDWIRALYHDLLGAGRVPSDADLSFWRSTAVRSGRSAVALSIYQSLENRRARVDRLYLQLLDRVADEPGRAFWAEQILRFGDLTLATFLASSTEYQQSADEFALAPPACTS